MKGFLVFPLDLGNVHEGEVVNCVEGKCHTVVCDKVEGETNHTLSSVVEKDLCQSGEGDDVTWG